MDYPGRVISPSEADEAVVCAVVERLKALGYASAAHDDYDDALAFQREAVPEPAHGRGRASAQGRRLGGAAHPGALFQTPAATAVTGLAGTALARARSKIGVMERPPGSNRGPDVEAFLKSVGVPPGNPWCMAFVSWCFQSGAREAKLANVFPTLGGCLEVWNKVQAEALDRIILAAATRQDPT